MIHEVLSKKLCNELTGLRNDINGTEREKQCLCVVMKVDSESGKCWCGI